jgi:hypothetical protein
MNLIAWVIAVVGAVALTGLIAKSLSGNETYKKHSGIFGFIIGLTLVFLLKVVIIPAITSSALDMMAAQSTASTATDKVELDRGKFGRAVVRNWLDVNIFELPDTDSDGWCDVVETSIGADPNVASSIRMK